MVKTNADGITSISFDTDIWVSVNGRGLSGERLVTRFRCPSLMFKEKKRTLVLGSIILSHQSLSKPLIKPYGFFLKDRIYKVTKPLWEEFLHLMTKSDKMGMKFYYFIIFLPRKFTQDIKTSKKQNISEHQSKFEEALYF